MSFAQIKPKKIILILKKFLAYISLCILALIFRGQTGAGVWIIG